MKLISAEVRSPAICALSHASSEAIDRAWDAVKGAAHPRIHIFLSSSDIHLMHQLKKSREEIFESAGNSVLPSEKIYDDIEFSPMDASRTDPQYLYQILEAVIEAGATTVNIPDTVGYAITREWGTRIEGIFKNVPIFIRQLSVCIAIMIWVWQSPIVWKL